MVTLSQMKAVTDAGHLLAQAAVEAYPNASDDTLRDTVCAVAVAMALDEIRDTESTPA